MQSKSIPKIPEAVRALERSREKLEVLSNILGLGDITTNDRTKTTVKAASYADQFARRTISVAAAVRIVFDSSPNQAGASQCVKLLGAHLPAALLARVKAVAGENDEEPPSAHAGPARKRARTVVKQEPLTVAEAAAAAASVGSCSSSKAKKPK